MPTDLAATASLSSVKFYNNIYFFKFDTSLFQGQVSYYQRQLEDFHKESSKRFQKLQKDVSHNVEELLRMVAFLESNYRGYVEALEAGQRARVKRLRDEQEENLRLQRAQNEAHIADLERQTQKMLKVSK